MKKQIAILALASMLAVSIAGCKGKESTDNVVTEENIKEYVTLGEYKGLNIEKNVYTITDQDIQNEIDAALDENADYKEITNRGAKKGDIITVSYKGTENGEEVEDATEDEYDFEIGIKEFGKEFDAGLIGMKVGDKKTITVTFDDDYEYDVWAGKTIDFAVKAIAINEKILPEYNDAFVSEYYDCKTTKDYEASLKKELEEEYEAVSNEEAGEEALSVAVSNATITGYPEDLYDSYYQEVKEGYEWYADMFGVDKSEIYNMFDMTEDDLKAEALELVNERLVVEAIATAEQISVTDEDYDNMIDACVDESECESQEELEETYGVDSIKAQMLGKKVSQYLIDHANIEEVQASIYDEE